MTSTDNTLELIEAWRFNVSLECDGRQPDELQIIIGGAVLDLRDLRCLLDRLTHFDTLAIAAGYPEGVEAALRAIGADPALALRAKPAKGGLGATRIGQGESK